MNKYLLCLVCLPYAFMTAAQTTPKVSGINCKEILETSLYPGEKLCFSICTFDSDIGDQVRIEASYTIPDATFDVLNKGDLYETGQFCWTPPANAYTGSPYYVNFTATDKNGLSSTSSVKISIKELARFTYEFEETGCGEGYFSIMEQSSGIIEQIIINKSAFPFTKGANNRFMVSGLSSGENKVFIAAISTGGYNPNIEASVRLEGGSVFNRDQMDEYACIGKDHVVQLYTALAKHTNFKWQDNSTERIRTLTVDRYTEMEVYGENGTCKDTLEVLLNIAEIKANFTATTGVGTVPFITSFKNSSGKDCNNFFWDFGDGSTSEEENPEHTYTEAGKHTVTLVSSRGGLGSCADTIVMTDFINAFPTTLPDIQPLGDLRVYPNPARDFLYVEAKASMEGMKVVNMEGQLVSTDYEQYGDQLLLDISQLDLGTYLVLVETKEGLYRQQFVVGP